MKGIIDVSSRNGREKTHTIFLTIFGVPPETLKGYFQSLTLILLMWRIW